MQSLSLSRQQGARAWELRTATDLAAYRASRGGAADARALLEPVFVQFEEGLDTQDMKTPEALLTRLHSPFPSPDSGNQGPGTVALGKPDASPLSKWSGARRRPVRNRLQRTIPC
jgi:hypothetical protein